MGFKRYTTISALNLIPLEEVENDIAPHIGNEYICLGNHEQYFYSDYLAYQPDYPEKIYKMGEYLQKNGYEFFYLDEIVK